MAFSHTALKHVIVGCKRVLTEEVITEGRVEISAKDFPKQHVKPFCSNHSVHSIHTHIIVCVNVSYTPEEVRRPSKLEVEVGMAAEVSRRSATER